jgi:hypothetical protein
VGVVAVYEGPVNIQDNPLKFVRQKFTHPVFILSFNASLRLAGRKVVHNQIQSL